MPSGTHVDDGDDGRSLLHLMPSRPVGHTADGPRLMPSGPADTTDESHLVPVGGLASPNSSSTGAPTDKNASEAQSIDDLLSPSHDDLTGPSQVNLPGPSHDEQSIDDLLSPSQDDQSIDDLLSPSHDDQSIDDLLRPSTDLGDFAHIGPGDHSPAHEQSIDEMLNLSNGDDFPPSEGGAGQ